LAKAYSFVCNYIDEILVKREILRKQGKYKEADSVRGDLEKIGFQIDDTPEGPAWRHGINYG